MIGALRDAWYVAAHGREIGRRPLGRTILGTKLALFRDARGVAHAIGAECPHRGADLSRGRVVGEHLECPYHGWRFAGSGRCAHIPSQAHVPDRARVPSWRVVESQRVVGIWGGDAAPPSSPPRYEFWDEDRGRARSMAGPIRVRAPFVHVMEQSIDASHAPFTHGGSLRLALRVGGDGAAREPRPELHLDEETGALWWRDAVPRPMRPSRLRALAGRLGVGAITARAVRFELGGQVWARYEYARGDWDVSMTQVCPADDASVWVFGDITATHGRHPIGRLLRRRFAERVLREDADTMSSLLRHDDPTALPGGVSVEGDVEGLAFRKWYRRALADQRATDDPTRDRPA